MLTLQYNKMLGDESSSNGMSEEYPDDEDDDDEVCPAGKKYNQDSGLRETKLYQDAGCR